MWLTWDLALNFSLYFFLILFGACGVKGDPQTPANSPTPSFVDNYPEIKLNDEDKKQVLKKKVIP
jgi:hypothetical protein